MKEKVGAKYGVSEMLVIAMLSGSKEAFEGVWDLQGKWDTRGR